MQALEYLSSVNLYIGVVAAGYLLLQVEVTSLLGSFRRLSTHYGTFSERLHVALWYNAHL